MKPFDKSRNITNALLLLKIIKLHFINILNLLKNPLLRFRLLQLFNRKQDMRNNPINIIKALISEPQINLKLRIAIITILPTRRQRVGETLTNEVR
jgi:hypothetical protein